MKNLINEDLERFNQIMGYNPSKGLIKEKEIERIRLYLIKRMNEKQIVNPEDKKEFLERFLDNQVPVGYNGETRMGNRIEAAQSLLDEL